MALGGFLPPVVAQILADASEYNAVMGETKAKMTGLQAQTAELAAAGKMAFAGLAAAVAVVGFESVKMAMNFDQTMEVIHTQAGATQAEVDDLKGKVLALAPAVGIGPEKLAEALFHIESTGMRGSAAMDVLQQAAKLAAIGMADLDDVTYAMSGVMSVGMKDVNNAADAISYMNATVGMGDMRMDALARAIGTGILPSFKSAGLGMADFSAAIATIADNSVPADEAATRLRMTVALMSAPSNKAAGALDSIGIASTQLADDMRQPNGLLVAVMDLKKHLQDSGKTASEQNAVIEEAFGGGRTSGAILTLLEESDRLKSKYDQLGTAESRAATTTDAWAQQQKQLSQQWHEFVALIQSAAIRIGEWLIPKLQQLATEVLPYLKQAWAEIMKTVNENKDGLEKFAKFIVEVVIPALAIALVTSIKDVTTAIDAIIWVIARVVPVIRFFTGLFLENMKFILDGAVAAFGWIPGLGPKLKDAQRDFDNFARDVMDKLNEIDGKKVDVNVAYHEYRAGERYSPSDNAVPVSGSHLPAFGSGGVVPGPIGQPRLVIAHGGERFLGADGSGSDGDTVINLTVVASPGGEVLRKEQLRYARRAVLSPADLYPTNTSSLKRF